MRSKFRIALIGLIVSFVFILAACSESSASDDTSGVTSNSGDQIRVGASNTSTWVYGFMSSWAEVLQGENEELNFVVQATAGSSAHYPMIEEGQLDMGSGFTPSEFYAARGEGGFDDEFSKFTAVMPNTTSVGHVFTTADSDIETVEDLNGVRIGLGARGSPTSIAAEVHVEALGIDAELIFTEPAELMNMMRDGRIDAIWYYAGGPWSNVLDLSSQVDLKFVSFTEEQIATLQEAAPYTASTTIDSDMYNYVEEDVLTPAAVQTIIASEDMDEDLVYEITKTSWENWDKVVELVPAAGSVSIEDASSMVGKIHPGALRYYEEVGIEFD